MTAIAVPVEAVQAPANWVIKKVTCRCHQLDGSVILKICYICPWSNCTLEFDELSAVSHHMLEGHGVQLESGIACDPCSAGEVSKRHVRIPNGEERVVCPLCIQQFQPDDSEGLYAHLAQEHGRLITSSRVNDVQFQGQSEHLDLLYANPSKHWFPRRDDVAERLHVVSLGCYCGIKTSLQHMGLGHAHLPFDWMRTTSAGVAHFVRNQFQGYFTCKSECDVPDSALKMQRSEQHSFWHDDIFQKPQRDKLQRRIDRFHGLSESSKDLLFLRSCCTTEELSDAENLYMALQECFSGSSHRVLLAVLVDGQPAFQGPILHTELPGLIFYQIGPHGENQKQAYCEAIASAVTLTLAAAEDISPQLGFAVMTLDRQEANLPEELFNVPSGHSMRNCVQCWDGGLNSGFADLTSFERPGPQPGEIGVQAGRAAGA